MGPHGLGFGVCHRARAVFRDEAIELAPSTGKADRDRWFDIVLVGHFSSGDIPAC